MNKCLIIIAALMLSACRSLPDPGGNIEGLSFTNFDGQPAAVFENRGAQTLVFGDINTGEITFFSQGQWNPSAPNFKEPIQIDPSFDDNLVVPMLTENAFVFEPPSAPSEPQPNPDYRLILGLNQNPCLPNAGCGGDFGRRLSRVLEFGVVFSCPDANASGFYSSKTECEERCEASCQSRQLFNRR